MVTLDSHGRSRYSAARKSHRLPVTDTERTNRARFVSVEMCLETCRTEFVASDLGIEPGVAFADVCSALTFTQPHEVFWKLYCCDSSRCRVHIDGGGPLEQSRRWPGEGASSAVGADSVQPTSTCLSISAETMGSTISTTQDLLPLRVGSRPPSCCQPSQVLFRLAVYQVCRHRHAKSLQRQQNQPP